MAVKHIVLFRIHDEASETDLDEALRLLRGLGDMPGVLEWRIELSSDTRKGRMIVEDAVSANAEALESFRTSAEHGLMAAHLSSISDWWVGDYVV